VLKLKSNGKVTIKDKTGKRFDVFASALVCDE